VTGRPLKRRPGRPALPPEQQRQRLLNAAERCFERNHYEGASIQDIVREAGMSSRSFYQFFESKEDLVTQLAQHRGDTLLAEMEKALVDANDMWESIDQLLRIYLELLPMVVVDLEWLSGTVSQRIRRLRDTYRERIGQLLIREMARMAEAGIAPTGPDPMSIALVIAGIENISIGYHHAGRREELLVLHPQIMQALHRLFPLPAPPPEPDEQP
jgi:AcrR family transcriptional regulator